MSAHNISVWQDGTKVAVASASNIVTAKREAMHYAFMYEQDGPVLVKHRNRIIYRTVSGNDAETFAETVSSHSL